MNLQAGRPGKTPERKSVKREAFEEALRKENTGEWRSLGEKADFWKLLLEQEEVEGAREESRE